MNDEYRQPKLVIEFTQHDCRREKTAHCEMIETDDPLPIAAVGDTVYISPPHAEKTILLHVERRRFWYHDGWTQVQLFCRKHDFDKSGSYEGP